VGARTFDSEIQIDSWDRWIFRGNEITQEEILKYFRSRLRENEHGIYIENEFGELRENGYVRVEGFPCHILRVLREEENLVFMTDAGFQAPLEAWDLLRTENDLLFASRLDAPRIRYRLDWTAATNLSEYLLEMDSSFYLSFGSVQREIPLFPGSLFVPIPTNFDFA